MCVPVCLKSKDRAYVPMCHGPMDRGVPRRGYINNKPGVTRVFVSSYQC